MITITTDKAAYLKARLQTPQQLTGNAFELCPGCCVKSIDQHAQYQFGIVQANTSDLCVVVGHGWTLEPRERFVWTGDRFELLATWKVD